MSYYLSIKKKSLTKYREIVSPRGCYSFLCLTVCREWGNLTPPHLQIIESSAWPPSPPLEDVNTEEFTVTNQNFIIYRFVM